MAFILDFLTKVMLNVAFIAGSSKHGNAFLASVGANIVVANHLIMIWSCLIKVGIKISYINLT